MGTRVLAHTSQLRTSCDQALVLLMIGMLSFAWGGNLLYPTALEFKSLTTSLYTLIYVLRRPMALPWAQMSEASMVFPGWNLLVDVSITSTVTSPCTNHQKRTVLQRMLSSPP